MTIATLTGSEKQVTWAEELRKGFFDDENIKKFHAIAGNPPEDFDERARKDVRDFTKMYEDICAVTKASWWIENRGFEPMPLALYVIHNGVDAKGHQ